MSHYTSAGFCHTTYEVMLDPSLEGAQGLGEEEEIKQKETKLTKFLEFSNRL